jgi:hypothetical protein
LIDDMSKVGNRMGRLGQVEQTQRKDLSGSRSMTATT